MITIRRVAGGYAPTQGGRGRRFGGAFPSPRPPHAGAVVTLPSFGARAALFDPSLSDPERAAARNALLHETNPNPLIGFAGALGPSAPALASLLFASAQLLELREPDRQVAATTDAQQAAMELCRLIEARSQGALRCQDLLQALCTPSLDSAAGLHAVVHAGSLGQWTDVAERVRTLAPPVLPWPRLERMKAALLGSRALHSAGTAAEQEAALALTGPGVHGLPLAETLQSLGFRDELVRTRGGTLRDRAADLLSAADEARARGQAIRHVLVRRRALEAGRASAEGLVLAGRAASDLVLDPSASLHDLPEPVGALARSVVEEVAPGVRIVDPGSARVAGLGRIRDPRDEAERARWVRWYGRRGA